MQPRPVTSTPSGAGRDGRLVLAIAALTGVTYVTSTALSSPDQVGLASDVYATAVGSWLDGGELYRVAPDDRPGFFFLYPPVSIPLFIPHAVLGVGVGAYLLQTVINIGVAAAIVVVLGRALDRRGIELTTVDKTVLVGFVFVSPYAMPHLIEGQTTLWLAFALVIGFDALDRGRETVAGAAFAVAALIKVFPAAVGIWLLRRHAVRGVATAVGVGIGALLLGLAFGPELTMQYLTDILTGRHGDQTARVADITADTGGIHRQIAGMTGHTGVGATAVAAVILSALLGLAYRRVDTDVHRLAAILATVSALLLFMPLQPLYNALLYFPVVLLIFTLAAGPARWLLLTGILATVTMVGYENFLDGVSLLPETLRPTLEVVGEAFYTVAVPPDIGLWLLLAAAILIHTEWYGARYPIARDGLVDPLE